VTPQILVVDDDVLVSQVLAEILRHAGGYNVTVEMDGRQVVRRLQNEKYDLVLLDIMMPEINGIDLLRQLKAYFDEVPVIMVTAYASVELAVEAMQIGAADFVTKPVEAAVLHIRVHKALEYARTKRLASTDGLTGLYNRRVFHERLQEEIERANRYERPLSLLMIDIDHFKMQNDTHGHLWGDTILVEVARLLKELSRTSDVVARYGGEEFAMILPETTQGQAVCIANRLRKTIENHCFIDMPSSGVVTVSVGAAMYRATECTTTFLAAADQALYAAKRGGRNCVHVA
jgi:diguanylate cyclase (GGDEF)-like protein